MPGSRQQDEAGVTRMAVFGVVSKAVMPELMVGGRFGRRREGEVARKLGGHMCCAALGR